MKRLLGAVVFAVVAALPASAQTPGITFGAAPSTFTAGIDATRGWQFSVTEAIFVTALGVYDAGGNGLSESHQVGLWDAGSALMASLVVPQGTGGSLGPDNFRYMMLGGGVLLNPGVFRIGAYYSDGSGDVIAQSAMPLGAPGFVEYEGARLLRGAFGDPTEVSQVAGGAFGPNFLFDPAASQVVPEPISVILLGTGLLGLGVMRTRRRPAQQ
jgi:hypothetical protein